MKRRIIGIISGKGGTGKTTFTVNTGIAMAKMNKPVTVVDADMTASNLGLQLGFFNFPFALQDALRKNLNIDSIVYDHISGMKFIPSSISLSCVDKNIKYDRIKSVLKKLDGIVLMDCPPGLDRDSCSIMKLCDELLLVTNPEITAITDGMKALTIAKELGKNITGIVVNRTRNDAYEIKKHEIEQFCGIRVIGEIPEDPLIRKCVYNRIPVAQHSNYSPASIAFNQIASHISGERYEKPRLLMLKRIFKR